ncbi:ABC transporter ATP-binding protein [Actinoplanes sp. NPDC051851]|uniref:ABC transporter ATP-binding protein n=1 Tax=Actinoplanes sp. NPDC051851 TaxID=3154753 RepID=UPI00341B4D77
MTLIHAAGLRKSYPGTPVIDEITFGQQEGEILGVVGPSGCGKTTLLRCLAGLDRPDSGTLDFDGRPVTGIPPDVSVVFQEYNRSLFPWLTALDNVRFPITHLGRAESGRRASEMLARVGLAEFAGHHPRQLSGGMQQRVAIARAVVSHPRYLLMDEPFASVDAQTRADLELLTLTIAAELRLTVLIITHDIDEAIFMADRVLVLSARPSRVLKELEVDLDRPRDEVETRALPAFQDYRREVHHLIHPGGAR